MIVPLSRAYAACGGNPVVHQVDNRIFTLTYFQDCMACSFCHDSCCQHGATVEEPLARKLLDLAAALQAFLPIPADNWFWNNCWWDDPDYPGGRFTRTQIADTPLGERCVFANRQGRGCGLHSFALAHGLPVRDVKPMACNLFPVLWDAGTLIVPIEIEDGTLICREAGVTLYRGARADLEHYFGMELIAELDSMERLAAPAEVRSGLVALPLAPVGASTEP